MFCRAMRTAKNPSKMFLVGPCGQQKIQISIGQDWGQTVFSCPHGPTQNIFERFLAIRMALQKNIDEEFLAVRVMCNYITIKNFCSLWWISENS